MAGDAERFFTALERWPFGRAASLAFERIQRSSAWPALGSWHARLFRSLGVWLLRQYDLPASAGAETWEWAPLFRLNDEVDPHYFSPRQLSETLAACPPVPAPAREEVLRILERYFAWRRGPPEFPDGMPLMSAAETRRWVDLFPDRLAWLCLDVPRAAGLYPLGDPAGYRWWRRLAHGEFQPVLSRAALLDWGELCSRGAGGGEALRRDFLAAAFAGALNRLGLEGPCGAVPECSACAMRTECTWVQRGAADSPAPDEARALLRREGPASFSTDRLLQVLFGLDAVDARRWNERLASTPLRKLGALSLPDLEQWLDGLSPDSERLQALFEFARRFVDERLLPGAAFRAADDVYRHFRLRLRDNKQEQFFLLLLDSRRRYQGEVAVSQGTMERALVHPRDVFGAAVRERAGAVVVVHNHPSGDPTPSPEDIQVTQRLSEAGTLLGIPLLDHVIVGEGRYFSLAEKGLMVKE